LNTFRRQFSEQHGVDLVFEQDAMKALEELGTQRNMSVMKLCSDLFRDFQYGMKLIQNNTGEKVFKLSREAIEAPDAYLSELVVASYPEHQRKPAAAEKTGVKAQKAAEKSSNEDEEKEPS